MAATEILVRFVSICKYSHRRIDWYFQGSVKRLPSNKTVFVGDPIEGIEMLRGGYHRFSGWEIPVKIQPEDRKIEIRLSGTRMRPTMDVIEKTEHVSIGDVKATLNVPIHHGYNLWMVSSEGTYSALIVVEVTKDTATAPGKISTVVAHQGASTYNTVHDGMQDMMVHICPVIPVHISRGHETKRPRESRVDTRPLPIPPRFRKSLCPDPDHPVPSVEPRPQQADLESGDRQRPLL